VPAPRIENPGAHSPRREERVATAHRVLAKSLGSSFRIAMLAAAVGFAIAVVCASIKTPRSGNAIGNSSRPRLTPPRSSRARERFGKSPECDLRWAQSGFPRDPS